MNFDFSILDFSAWMLLGVVYFTVFSFIRSFIFWIYSKIDFLKKKKTTRKDDTGGDGQCTKS